MAWDKGFNFRDTSGFVTDGTDETYCLKENYPVTRNSVTFGFTDGLGGDRTRDRDNTANRRQAGGHFTNSSGSQDRVLVFRVDLPAAGDYIIRVSVGDRTNTRINQKAEVFDNTTSKGVIVNDASCASDHYVDATNVERTSDTDWGTNNASTTITFASTTFVLKIGTTAAASDNTFLTHIFLSQVAAAATIKQLAALGVG